MGKWVTGYRFCTEKKRDKTLVASTTIHFLQTWSSIFAFCEREAAGWHSFSLFTADHGTFIHSFMMTILQLFFFSILTIPPFLDVYIRHYTHDG